MPRPRQYPPERQTPFAQRLQEWMWGQRPPMQNGQLAIRISTTEYPVNSHMVWNWLNRGSVPDPKVFSELTHVTGIPLADWYELADYPSDVVQYLRRPRRHTLPQELTDAYWDWWIADTVEIMRAGMRREGIDERKIEQALQEIVADMRRRQKGKDYVPYVEREFAIPSPETIVEADQRIAERPVDYADQPTQTLQQVKPTKPSISERRAPRRRETAKPKTQS